MLAGMGDEILRAIEGGAGPKVALHEAMKAGVGVQGPMGYHPEMTVDPGGEPVFRRATAVDCDCPASVRQPSAWVPARSLCSQPILSLRTDEVLRSITTCFNIQLEGLPVRQRRCSKASTASAC